ncbi:MAG: DUF2232 domain-containing protein [Lysinibacillus sp.]
MPNNQTKALMQGLATVALFTLLMTVSFVVVYIPILFFIVLLFAPIPIAWYSSQHKRSAAIVVALSSCLLTFFITGSTLLSISAIFALIGLVIGDAIREKKSKLYMFMSTGLALLFSIMAVFVGYIKLANVNIIENSLALFQKSAEETYEMTKSVTGNSAMTMEQIDLMIKTTELTIPAIITIIAFSIAFIIITVNLPILQRLGIEIPKFPPFKDMRLPNAILWYYMIVLSIGLFIQPEAGSTLDVITLNVSSILWVLLILQGFSLIHYFMTEKGVPKVVRWVATLVLLPLSSFVILLGIIDLGFNVRSLVKGKNRD